MAKAKGKHAPQKKHVPDAAPQDGLDQQTDDKYAAALAALAEEDEAPVTTPVERATPEGSPIFDDGEGDGRDEALAALASEDAQESQAAPVFETISSSTPLASGTPQFAPGAPEPRRRSAAGAFAIALLVLAALAGGAYVGGATYLEGRFLPRTTLDGHDVSLLTPEEAAAFSTSEIGAYTAHVTGQGLDVTLTPADAGLTVDTVGEAQAALDQFDRWHWPLDIMDEHVLTTPHEVTVDEEVLAQSLAEPIAKVNENATEPIDATMAYVDEHDAFEVIPEVPGTAIKADEVLAIVSKAIVDLPPTIEIDESVLEMPAVTQDDPHLIEAAEKANYFIQGGVQLTVRGEVVDEVDADTIRGWIVLDDDLNATFDSSGITEWARGPFSEKHDTLGVERTYTRPDGKTFHVSGGTYGWCVNGAELADALVEAIEEGSREPIEMPMFTTAERWVEPGQQDWGDTYIDLSLTDQHMIYYVDGKVKLECDVVTGNASDKHATPTGVYYINSNKNVKQHLIGADEDHDKKPDYESDVDYWMPFINNSVAFHDAPWRASFGGEIYYSNGSHGCVNMPADKAKELYELAPVGTVVVVHN